MPTYEYECEACHHTFELTQRFTDPPPKACPRCQGRVRKVFHPVGIIFKGSGWHVTDYDKHGAKGSRNPVKDPTSKDKVTVPDD